MSQTGHNNISKIISISVAVLALILLLLYMQGILSARCIRIKPTG